MAPSLLCSALLWPASRRVVQTVAICPHWPSLVAAPTAAGPMLHQNGSIMRFALPLLLLASMAVQSCLGQRMPDKCGACRAVAVCALCFYSLRTPALIRSSPVPHARLCHPRSAPVLRSTSLHACIVPDQSFPTPCRASWLIGWTRSGRATTWTCGTAWTSTATDMAKSLTTSKRASAFMRCGLSC